jgi:peptide-methionine (S)-S-oxide reductase
MKPLLLFTLMTFLGLDCQTAPEPATKKASTMDQTTETSAPTYNPETATEVATLGGGCFWCVEAIYQDLQGVSKVVSGYSGGSTSNPTYREICTGLTGHAEVIQVHFDPSVTTYREILDIFFTVHDPTTLNRQGNDVGTQYRSVIYYHSDEQRQTAEAAKVAAAALWDDPIVTEIAKFDRFYAAEAYHQNYYKDNPNQPYCSFIITPKVKKFREKYQSKLKQ